MDLKKRNRLIDQLNKEKFKTLQISDQNQNKIPHVKNVLNFQNEIQRQNPYISQESYDLLFSRKKTHPNKLETLSHQEQLNKEQTKKKQEAIQSIQSMHNQRQKPQQITQEEKEFTSPLKFSSLDNFKSIVFSPRTRNTTFTPTERLNYQQRALGEGNLKLSIPIQTQIQNPFSANYESETFQKKQPNQISDLKNQIAQNQSKLNGQDQFLIRVNKNRHQIQSHEGFQLNSPNNQEEEFQVKSPLQDDDALKETQQISESIKQIHPIITVSNQQEQNEIQNSSANNQNNLRRKQFISSAKNKEQAPSNCDFQKNFSSSIKLNEQNSTPLLQEIDSMQRTISPSIQVSELNQNPINRTSKNNQPDKWISILDLEKQFTALKQKILQSEDILEHLNIDNGKQEPNLRKNFTDNVQSENEKVKQNKITIFKQIQQIFSGMQDSVKHDQSLLQDIALNQSIQYTKQNPMKLEKSLVTMGNSPDQINQLDQSIFKKSPSVIESSRRVEDVQTVIKLNKRKYLSFESSPLLTFQQSDLNFLKVPNSEQSDQIIENENESQNQLSEKDNTPICSKLLLLYQFNSLQTRLYKTNQINLLKTFLKKNQSFEDREIQNFPQIVFVQNYCSQIMHWVEKQVYHFGDLSELITPINQDENEQLCKIFERIRTKFKTIKKSQTDDNMDYKRKKSEEAILMKSSQRRQGVLNLNVNIFENDELYFIKQHNPQANIRLKNGQVLQPTKVKNYIPKNDNQNYFNIIISTIDNDTRNTLLSQINQIQIEDQFKVTINQTEYKKKWEQINQYEKQFEFKDHKKQFIHSLHQYFQKDSFEDTFESTYCFQIEEQIKQEKGQIIKYNKSKEKFRAGETPEHINLTAEPQKQILMLRSNYLLDGTGTPKSSRMNSEKNSQPSNREFQKPTASPKHDQSQSFQDKQKVLQKQYQLKMGMNPNALLTRTQIMQGQQRKKLSINNQAVQIVQNNNVQDLFEFFHQNPNLQINHQNKNGNTLLILASQSGFLEAVQLLVKNDANVNLQNNDGDTALHKALLHKFYDIADFLISQGAITSIQNNNGITPWQVEFQNY